MSFSLKLSLCTGDPPQSNTCFLEPTWPHNPNGILIGSAVFTQLMTVSSGTPAICFPIKIAHSHVDHASLGPPESSTQMASRSVQPFFHSSRQSVLILCNGPLFPFLKIVPSHEGCGHHLIHGSFTSEPTTKTASWLVQPFSHSSLHSVPTLYNGLPLLPNCPLP